MCARSPLLLRRQYWRRRKAMLRTWRLNRGTFAAVRWWA